MRKGNQENRIVQNLSRLVSNLYTRLNLLLMSLIVLSSFALKLKNLGHKTITLYDELFHALVAKNLLKHFFKFTLYDKPFLAYNFKHWGQNHIWLHKPPLAMWKIAVSYYVLGVNNFALRLPSALLSTGASVFTYLIGTELYNKHIGLIAAFLQAFNPFLLELVHGYRFSDHIDITLLFWIEVSCYFLIKGIKKGESKQYLFSGVACGLAYLSKSFLGLIAFSIAVAIFGLVKTGWLKEYQETLCIKKIGFFALSFIVTVAPWTIYCLILYPKEYLYEIEMVLGHLNSNIEGWQAPWDKHLFDYMALIYPIIYVAVLISFFYIVVLALHKRDLGNTFTAIWIVGTLIPLSVASSKTPSATDIALPALLLCFAVMAERALVKVHYKTTVILSSLLLSVFLFSKGSKNKDVFRGGIIWLSSKLTARVKFIGPSIKTNSWIVTQLLGFLLLVGIISLVYLSARKFLFKKGFLQYVQTLRLLSLILICIFTLSYLKQAVLVTQRDQKKAKWAFFGRQIKEALPENSVFLWEDCPGNAYLYLMFYSDRSVYTLKEPLGAFALSAREGNPQGKSLKQLIDEAKENGAKPYLISSSEDYDYPLALKTNLPSFYQVFDLSVP